MRPQEHRSAVSSALRAFRLLRSASENALESLASCAVVRDYAGGSQLACEGDPATEYGVVVSGALRVYRTGLDGRLFILESLGPNDPAGVAAALAGGRHPASIESTAATTVAWLPRKTLLELAANEPAVARDLVSDLAGSVVHLTASAHSLSLDVTARLAGYLFQRALATSTPATHGITVKIGMPKRELAAALGTVPETLSRALARLREDGVLEVHGDTVTVLDVRALAQCASGRTRS